MRMRHLPATLHVRQVLLHIAMPQAAHPRPDLLHSASRRSTAGDSACLPQLATPITTVIASASSGEAQVHAREGAGRGKAQHGLLLGCCSPPLWGEGRGEGLAACQWGAWLAPTPALPQRGEGGPQPPLPQAGEVASLVGVASMRMRHLPATLHVRQVLLHIAMPQAAHPRPDLPTVASRRSTAGDSACLARCWPRRSPP